MAAATRRAGCAVAALALGLACAEPPPRPSFLIVSLDTTRADHVGAYGYPRATTPRIDALAARGSVFEQAVTVSENTLISHASLFTGLFPAAHGATHEGDGRRLAGAAITLAEDLAAAGWQTAGFAAHADWLSRDFAMDQGFETWSSAYRPAEAVLAEAADWLADRDRSRPFLLFVHLYDVHSDPRGRPYGAPPPFRGRFTGGYRGRLGGWEQRPPQRQGSAFLESLRDPSRADDLSPADVQHLRDQYDEGLAHADHALGEFIDDLDPRDADTTWLVVVADHGEEFLEHGEPLHTTLYDPVVHVPLVVVPPRSGDAPELPARVGDQVRIVDLRPTVLELAGLEAPALCQGTSLVPLLAGEPTNDPRAAPLYHHALRQGGLKLYRRPDGEHLYDLARDPAETRNVRDDPRYAESLARLRRLLRAQRDSDAQVAAWIAERGGAPAPVEVAPDAAERLRALGYAD